MKRLAILCALALASVAQAADVSHLRTIKTKDGQEHALGLLKSQKPVHGVLFWAPTVRYSAPAEYDLRDLGLVSPIQDQKQCGSCWAFSITKTLESARLKAGKTLLGLSEQELVSCDTGAYGCNGGMMDDMAYVVNHGLPTREDYPYSSGGGSTGRCKSGHTVAEKGVKWGYVGSENGTPSMDQIKQALQDYGVLSTVVAAGGADWDGGNGGNMTSCRNSGQNHMVNIVGWTQKKGGEKLIGANSWNTSWGDKGFFYSKQGCNEYASGSQAVSFVVVEGGPAPTPPHVQLPAEVDVLPNTEVMLGVKSQPGVTYSWTADGAALPDTDSMIYVTPEKDTVYQITAKTAAGTAQSSVKVHVLPAPSFD